MTNARHTQPLGIECSLVWHESSVYNVLLGPVTLATVAESLAVELPLPSWTTKLCRDRRSKPICDKNVLQMSHREISCLGPDLNISQKARGPHCSPQKTVYLINTYDYQNVKWEKKKSIIYCMRIDRFFFWTNLNPLYLRTICDKFGWVGLVVQKKKILLIPSMYFRHLVIISPWERVGPFIWRKLNPLHPRMLCTKFGWNWHSGSGEEHENVKSLWKRQRQQRRTTDKFWWKKLIWAFGSEELKSVGLVSNFSIFSDLKTLNLTFPCFPLSIFAYVVFIYTVVMIHWFVIAMY